MPNPEGGTPVTQTFSSTEGRFRFGLPGGEKTGNDDRKDFKWFIINLGEFHVNYYDSDRVLDTPDVSEANLKQLRDMVVSKRPNGKLEVDSPITLSGHPGRELRMKDDTGTQIDRMYLAGNRIYVVSVFVSERLGCKLEPAVKVLDTFEITE